ncbi:MAG: alpha-N-arabinofuranosidase [Bacilli bacterium]|nr:alpha-N-arabinofuranosidase [Bacilli bacterium]
MKHYKLECHKNFEIGQIENTLFSSFIEHLGRAVYGGIYEPTHKTADKDGFREDVVSLVKDLNLSLVRYPGGNFVSNYFWEDGIGPREKRPTKTEEAWHSIEPNTIGTDEFMIWCKKAGVKPMMAVNLGTGSTDNARNLVEYCNSTMDTKYVNMRKEYGSKEPYKVTHWCLGNEMDGPWQIGNLPAPEYAKKAKEAAEKMKAIDPDIKFIACGSSMIDMPTFPEWDRIVCEELYNTVDYLSIHQYFFESTTEEDYFASGLAMDNYINILRSVLNYAKAKNRGNKDLYLCFDEFNIWYNTGKLPEDYQIAPPILEEHQSFKDVLVFTSLLNTLLNNCDVVKIACLAQLVNVIAPIMTQNNGEAMKNAIYHPYYLVSKYCRGKTLKVNVIGGEQFDSRFGKANYISQCVTYNENEVVVLLTNFAKEETNINLTIGDFDIKGVIEHIEMIGKYDDRNTFENPNVILPHIVEDAIALKNNELNITLPVSSWTMIRFKI